MKDDTKIIAGGRPKRRPAHPVNYPVERASTYLFPTYDDYLEGARNITYGRLGSTTHRALEEAVTLLEGGAETRLASSGLAAVNLSILAFCKAGDHVLVGDNVYDPVRKFCERFLRRFNVATTFYDPLDLDSLQEQVTDQTTVILAESPGSLTFEVQDIAATATIAERAGAKLVVDNTWSAGYFFKPIAHGAHVSVQSGTKYLAGHADCLIGTITSADETTGKAIFQSLLENGSNVSADDAYLTLRGMRTLAARMKRHEENGMAVARWLSKRAEVEAVLHPAFKTCPGHAVWKRAFSGSTGLFGVTLKPLPLPALKAMLNATQLFGMGFSWGGFESLCIHVHPERNRSARPWTAEGPTLRIHAGLEDPEDLIGDLDRAFAAMKPHL